MLEISRVGSYGFQSSRVGPDVRVGSGSFQNLAGRVRSGQEVCRRCVRPQLARTVNKTLNKTNALINLTRFWEHTTWNQCDVLFFSILFLFSVADGGKKKLKFTTLPGIFTRIVGQFNSVVFAIQRCVAGVSFGCRGNGSAAYFFDTRRICSAVKKTTSRRLPVLSLLGGPRLAITQIRNAIFSSWDRIVR